MSPWGPLMRAASVANLRVPGENYRVILLA